MSSFPVCECCEKVATKACNCSDPPRFFCNDHAFSHISLQGGIHPFQDAIEQVSEDDVYLLQRALAIYQSQLIQQVIDARNQITNSLLDKIRRIDQESSRIVEKVYQGKTNKSVEEAIFLKSFPLFSNDSVLKRLLYLKQSKEFFFPNIVKELFSFPSISTEAFSSLRLSIQNTPLTISSTSQVSYFPESTTQSPIKKPPVFSHSSKSMASPHFLTQASSPQSDSYLQKTMLGTGTSQTPQWDLAKKIKAHSGKFIGLKKQITCIAISNCNKYFASASADKSIKIWELASYKPIDTLKGHSGWVRSVSYLNNKLVSGSDDSTLKIWEDGRCVNTLTLHSAAVYSVCVSSCGRLIASGGKDKTIIVYNIEDVRTLHYLQSHFDCVTSVAFTENNREIVSGSEDRSVKIWKTETGELLRTLDGHDGEVLCVNISDKYFVSSSYDNSIKLWNRQTCEESISIRVHSALVAAVHSCNNILASIGGDNLIRVWDLDRDEIIQTLKAHGAHESWYNWHVGSLKFVDGGQFLVSGGADGVIKIWKRRN